MQITYKEFEKHIKDVVSITELSNALSEIGNKYYRDNGSGEFVFEFPDLSYNVIQLLEMLTNDKQEWIEYWVYELRCGKKANEYDVTDSAGNPVPLATISELWNVLVAQERYFKEHE